MNRIDGKLLGHIKIVDSVLTGLAKKALLENSDFEQNLVHPGYLIATLKIPAPHIRFVFTITNDALQLHIDQIDEAIWWDAEFLNTEHKKVESDIRVLLTSQLEVIHRIGFRGIRAISPDGATLLVLRRFLGLRSIFSFLPIKTQFSYSAIYSSK